MIQFLNNKGELLRILSGIPSAKAAHGEASFGYSFELKNGTIITIGQSDEDASDPHICWIKYYNPNKWMIIH